MKNKFLQAGQTLTTLLIFMAITVTITTGAVVIIVAGSKNAAAFQSGIIAMQIAESGAENGLIRLLRNPNYTGETMTVGGGTATIAISGTTTRTMDVTGQYGDHIRKIRVTIGYDTGILVVTPPWQEIYP